MFSQIYTVTQNNVPHLTCYNLDAHEPIMIIFGRSVTENVRNQKTLFSYLTYLLPSASALPCEIGNPQDRALVHSACNTVQLLQRSWLRSCWTMPPNSPKMNALITRFRKSYNSMSISRESKKTEEIKQRKVEFWQCTDTGFEWKCNFRVSRFAR